MGWGCGLPIFNLISLGRFAVIHIVTKRRKSHYLGESSIYIYESL